MSDKNVRIRLNAETTANLNAYCEATGAAINDVVGVAVAQFLHVTAPENEVWPNLAQGVGQNGPDDRAKMAQTEQTYEPPRLGRTTGKPKRDYQAPDSDEIRALIDEYNSLPDPFATTDEDVMLIRSKTCRRSVETRPTFAPSRANCRQINDLPLARVAEAVLPALRRGPFRRPHPGARLF